MSSISKGKGPLLKTPAKKAPRKQATPRRSPRYSKVNPLFTIASDNEEVDEEEDADDEEEEGEEGEEEGEEGEEEDEEEDLHIDTDSEAEDNEDLTHSKAPPQRAENRK